MSRSFSQMVGSRLIRKCQLLGISAKDHLSGLQGALCRQVFKQQEERFVGSIGYARVSTKDQNADLVHVALKVAGCHLIFTDHGVSGSKATRPQLDKMFEHLRDGDEVVVWKLDRLGRNTRNLLTFIDDLERRECTSAASRKASVQRARWAGPCSRLCQRSPNSNAIS